MVVLALTLLVAADKLEDDPIFTPEELWDFGPNPWHSGPRKCALSLSL